LLRLPISVGVLDIGAVENSTLAKRWMTPRRLSLVGKYGLCAHRYMSDDR
jgi:hypothetical protein